MGSLAGELVHLHCLHSIQAAFSFREWSSVTRLLVERLGGEGYRGLRILQTVGSAAKELGQSPLGKLEEKWPEVLAEWEKCVVLACFLYGGACALMRALVVSFDWLGEFWGDELGAAPRAFEYWPDLD